MKRTVSVLLAIALLLTGSGCGRKHDDFEQPVSFYYMSLDTEESVFAAETREAKSYVSDLLTLTNHYFVGPVNEAYVNVFPVGLYAISLTDEGDRLVVTVSDELSTLSGLELSIACTCIAMTLFDITGIEKVEIMAENELLDSKKSVIITMDDLYLQDITLLTD